MKQLTQLFLMWICIDLILSKESTGDSVESQCVPKVWNKYTKGVYSSSKVVPCQKQYVRKGTIENQTVNNNSQNNKSNKTNDDNHQPSHEEPDDNEFDRGESVGILGTLKNLTYWAIKEEFIYDLAEHRLNRLRREVELLEE